ncbi:carboxypeptidase regulatory-like domain-containing protein [Vitiosangium sp. GDMCC 1.1324]|uniref:carboxypeptidase regulatory-like domain-containing protein n=1 Tax=Vitiosangium sp. (strain GDMCC 1.1324) TaxID=2138576 RepID=UPI0011B62D68|nr:carboxypeptidase regulatory-like domain-containing protein [Vitiosangium sp. GDMCC 1.1324]
MLCLLVSLAAGCPAIETGIVAGQIVASAGLELSSPAVTDATQEKVGAPGVECTLEGTNKRAVTDSKGYFRYSGLSVGSYLLICKRTTSTGVYALLMPIEVPRAEQGAGNVALGALELTAAGSLQGIARLADQSEHTGISVYVPGTSLRAQTNAQGEWLINVVPAGSYALRFEKEGYRPLTLPAVQVPPGARVSLEARELNVSTGPSGSILLAGGRSLTGSRTVEVTLEGSQDASLYMLSESSDFIGATWKVMTPSTSWTFSGDGLQKLYARFSDTGGLETPPVTDSIIVDTTPPVDAQVRINSGMAVVTSRQVVLTLSARDQSSQVAEMKVSNDPALADASWEPFSGTREWTLSDASSQTAVYVTFRDELGNEMPEPVSAQVTVVTGTMVAGKLPASSQWTLAGSPYVVTGDLFVPVGGVLTIEPGVEVRFNGPHKLSVSGELVARGTATNRIVFASNAAHPQPGDWKGILFEDSSTDAVLDDSDEYLRGSVLAFTEIRDAVEGVSISRSSPLVTDNHFHHNGHGDSTLILSRSASVIRHNLIEQNTSRGIHAYACDARIVGNTLQENSGGMYLYAYSAQSCDSGEVPALIENNRLLRNTAGAIAIYGGAALVRHNEVRDNVTDSALNGSNGSGAAFSIGFGAPVIEYNLIENNRGPVGSSSTFSLWGGSMVLRYNTVSNPTTYEIHFPSGFLSEDVSASSNYWGTTDMDAVNARVWDREDDPTLPRVILAPLLSAPDPNAGMK